MIRRQLLALSVLVIFTACNSATDSQPEASRVSASENILLKPWSGPYGGVPPFNQMQLSDLEAAMNAAMAENLAELEVIAANPEAPTFENTILAMERSGDSFTRVSSLYGVWRSNLSSPEFRDIQDNLTPKISAFYSKITQNTKLFQRIQAVRSSPQLATLRPDQQRLVQQVYDGFALSGATLTGEARKRFAEIDARMAELRTQFGNNVLADEEGYVHYLTAEQLSGLPDSFAASAKAAAEQRDKEDSFAITNTRSSIDPFLTFSDERDLREQVWRTFYNRGDNGDDKDNNATIAELLKLRHERVQLMGFDSYAAWRLSNRMAKTPDRAYDLMLAVWPAAVARVDEEVADMQAVADAENADITIAPWDYRYYAEKVRREKYDLDSNEVKAYLQLDKLREAMFFVAGELFNFSFTAVAEGEVPVFHPDVRVWKVSDKDSGELVGLWYLDPFARPGKRSGAWAISYRNHTTFDGKKTVLSSNNSNFIKGAPGEPVLVSWSDATTFFHEFGHALHALSSVAEYPSQNFGVRDYTEFQSQLLERWLSTDKVIDKYLVHYQTGEPIPAKLVEKIKNAAKFNQGFSTVEYLASALVDMKYHTADPADINPDQFEVDTLAGLGMPDELVMRHRSPHFGHIFSGEAYSAGYYGYMWADVLTSDASEAFAEAPGGFYDKEVAARLVKYLFSARNMIDPAEAYRKFRGRDATIDALMRDRGFPVPAGD